MKLIDIKKTLDPTAQAQLDQRVNSLSAADKKTVKDNDYQDENELMEAIARFENGSPTPVPTGRVRKFANQLVAPAISTYVAKIIGTKRTVLQGANGSADREQVELELDCPAIRQEYFRVRISKNQAEGLGASELAAGAYLSFKAGRPIAGKTSWLMFLGLDEATAKANLAAAGGTGTPLTEITTPSVVTARSEYGESTDGTGFFAPVLHSEALSSTEIENLQLRSLRATGVEYFTRMNPAASAVYQKALQEGAGSAEGDALGAKAAQKHNAEALKEAAQMWANLSENDKALLIENGVENAISYWKLLKG